MKKILLGVTVALLAFTGVITYAVTKDTTPTPTITYTAPRTVTEQPKPPTVKELLKLVNAERKKVGVAPLVIDERLNKSAQIKADELEREGWDDTPHVNDDGKRGAEYARDYTTGCQRVSENLYYGEDEFRTSKQAVYWWMDSPPHKKAMLDSGYDLTGLSIEGIYFVQHFCDLP